jgi:tryptophanyl-tRNA synthetase
MAERRPRIFSGHRPTGRLHLGHLEGTLRNWAALQDDYDCIFGIANWHALTDHFDDTRNLASYTEDIAIDWLAAGLDPVRSILMVQSQVKQHAELELLLSMVTPLSWLERCPTWKDVLAQEDLADEMRSYGRLGYPVLQTADIIVYKSDLVPVGKDQLPHIELSREIARRFNHIYGDVFPEPAAKLSDFPAVPGLDGRKMSKSYGNTIELADPPEVVRKKIKTMFTDPLKIRMGDHGHPEGCPVFALHKIYTAPARVAEIEAECKAGTLGCVACKHELADNMIGALAPLHERRAVLERDRAQVIGILAEGNDRAREIAEATMVEVRRAMRLPFAGGE